MCLERRVARRLRLEPLLLAGHRLLLGKLALELLRESSLLALEKPRLLRRRAVKTGALLLERVPLLVLAVILRVSALLVLVVHWGRKEVVGGVWVERWCTGLCRRSTEPLSQIEEIVYRNCNNF